MIIKVCGMRDCQNIHEVAKLKPNMMGFIFYPKSKRYVGEDFEPASLQTVMPEVQTVGVFVNEETDRVIALSRRYKLDFVQLHGNESPYMCEEIKEKGIKVLKAFGIHADFDWKILNPYIGACDYFLFDTNTQNYGGSGQKFDWNILHNYKLQYPFILSGGIGPEDVETIKKIKHLQLAGIDLNSCFEIEPGFKDILKLQTFMKALNN
jgi:phosphoribosylanthranilate isomerase